MMTEDTQHGNVSLRRETVLGTISKRSGKLKSSCMVEHCHRLPIASLILMSILGPTKEEEGLIYV